MNLVELKQVRKYFPIKKSSQWRKEYVRAVDGVDLVIKEGLNLGLVGESGSGKTTLGRIILKLYAIDSGQIFIAGRDVTNFSLSKMRPFRKLIQMVFQDPYNSLDPRYTTRNILREALLVDKISRDPLKQEDIFKRQLASVGLSADSLERFPHEFSGGERQRIAIARTLVMNPKLLILDEAVSSLDVLIQEQILQLLADLQKKYELTYLFITHNLRVVKKLCPLTAVMYRGKIVEIAGTEEIFHNPLHPYTQELLEAAVHYRAVKRDWEMIISEDSHLIDKGNDHFVIN